MCVLDFRQAGRRLAAGDRKSAIVLVQRRSEKITYFTIDLSKEEIKSHVAEKLHRREYYDVPAREAYADTLVHERPNFSSQVS